MSDFDNIEQRLDNWGFTVRSPKFQSGVCAQWAQLYVAIRDGAIAPSAVTPVEKDGWLVEAAWAAMDNHVSKWVLKYTYVWRMAPDQVQTRMRKVHKVVLRGRPFELVLAEAHRAVSKRIVDLTAHEIVQNVRTGCCKRSDHVL